MDLQVITPPGEQAVTTELVRLNQRITNQIEDAIIAEKIEAAADLIGAEINRPLIETEYQLTFEMVYPKFRLPRPPFVSFSSLTYQIDGSDEVTVDTSGMTPRYVRMLPEFKIAAFDPDYDTPFEGEMTIQWTAGWTAATLPARLKTAVVMLAGHLFKHRDASHLDPRIMDVVKTTPFYDRLFQTYRIPNVNDEDLDRYC